MNAAFALRYLNYYFTAGNRHSVHSPFIYFLVDKIINSKKEEPVFAVIEQQRNLLKKNHSLIAVEDYGAGIYGVIHQQRKVSSIVKSSAKPARYGSLLYKIVNHYRPLNMLELGTSFGISALYQAAGNPDGKLYTIEGSKSIAEIAGEVVKSTGISNIHIVQGSFDKMLPVVLDKMPQLDYAFIDGNHKKKPTLEYFEQCLGKSHNHTIFVFDDINWSDDMQEAWELIKSHKKTRVTVDLFMLGIVFLNPELSRQDFVIRH
ncbi:MAG: class I SAM-dependent methyltransferase [Bacteroidota bacterium]